MIRKFTEAALEQMCLVRPASYREAVLKLSVKLPDGSYELDTGSREYHAVKLKYNSMAAATVPSGNVARPGANFGDRNKVVMPDSMLKVMPELLEILGAESKFGLGYKQYLVNEKAGKCRGCARGRYQKQLVDTFIATLNASTPELVTRARALFPDTVYVTMFPSPVKWESFPGQAKQTVKEGQ